MSSLKGFFRLTYSYEKSVPQRSVPVIIHATIGFINAKMVSGISVDGPFDPSGAFRFHETFNGVERNEEASEERRVRIARRGRDPRFPGRT